MSEKENLKTTNLRRKLLNKGKTENCTFGKEQMLSMNNPKKDNSGKKKLKGTILTGEMMKTASSKKEQTGNDTAGKKQSEKGQF